MAHSENYEKNVISLAQFKEKRATKTNNGLVIYLTNGTKAQAEAHTLNQLNNWGITEPRDINVFLRAIRRGVLLYCRLINKNRITLNEAGIIVEICLMAIFDNKANKVESPFEITAMQLIASSVKYNEEMGINE